jgi:hypothetical protein
MIVVKETQFMCYRLEILTYWGTWRHEASRYVEWVQEHSDTKASLTEFPISMDLQSKPIMGKQSFIGKERPCMVVATYASRIAGELWNFCQILSAFPVRI